MTDCIGAIWDGSALVLRSDPGLDVGERVTVEITRARTGQTHRHQFAWVREAWETLPEHVAMQPWAETPETLRKHALIATGYHSKTVLAMESKKAARDVKAAMLATHSTAHGYALGAVVGSILTIWTPDSQSYKAMGRERFNESKRAILEWIAAQIEVSPAALAAI